ncbi:hypothetical protein LTR56_003082 [Elasticomyces elasticus]|nr:hypothetical protein LTR56_003082 [Elasticomyces elasticus]KAK3662144.1 hypothetical protein LTR22_007117 [Elasticomyces elasticus]KAK5749748.1 hypothetical protein LTS12_020176 [Elasticomyces elasticus]
MSFKTLAIAYIFGGLTFLPLLLATILLLAWLWLPRRQHDAAGSTKSDVLEGEKHHASSKGKEEDDDTTAEGNAAADATFAVLRQYHFPSALTALSARASGNNGSNAGTGTMDNSGGETTAASGESVYQSMYRTVFDRGKPVSVLERDSEDISGVEGPAGRLKRKPVVSATVFYIVLRHGHLMLYDSAAHTEVRHVISLAHHAVSLTDGETDVLPDSDLFIKRTAIQLTPLVLQHGKLQVQSTARPKPFYFFSSTCIEKEDFYHALLSSRASPPIPQPIAPEDLIKLQSTLHSSSLTPETRAINALIGRIFLAFHRTSFLEHEIRSRIEKKIARVQKPAFIASLEVVTIDLGSNSPVLSQPRLKDINVSGDMTIAFDFRYAGGVRVGIAAMAKIDLGARFKPRSIDLVLSTAIQRVSGRILVRIKPPPSNRIWFCFESAPELDVKVEPVVSSRQITYAFILRAIEDRIRAVVAETLVKPNWDDIAISDTRSQRIRGGLWVDEGAPDDEVEVEEGVRQTLFEASEKSRSTPALNAAMDAMDASADYATSTAKDQANPLKRRSVASLPLKHAATMPRPEMAPPPLSHKPLRSPSFTSPPPSIPITAVDGKWRTKASAQGPHRKEAVQAVREMHDRAVPATLSSDSVTSLNTADNHDIDTDASGTESRRLSDASSERITYDSSSRTNTMHSQASTSSSTSSRQTPNQRKNLLAATAAATTAARNWGWNAIANRTAGRGSEPRQQSFRQPGNAPPPTQPMGRGQPLPPPGTPLPRPETQKGLFGSLGGGMVGKGSVKRKPVLPPRNSSGHGDGGFVPAESKSASVSSLEVGTRRSSELSAGRSRPSTRDEPDRTEDDFGPWRENSGRQSPRKVTGDLPSSGHEDAAFQQNADPNTVPTMLDTGEMHGTHPETPSDIAAERGFPPPLPARRPTAPRDHAAHRSYEIPATQQTHSNGSGHAAPEDGYAAALAQFIAKEEAMAELRDMTDGDRAASLSEMDEIEEMPTLKEEPPEHDVVNDDGPSNVLGEATTERPP